MKLPERVIDVGTPLKPVISGATLFTVKLTVSTTKPKSFVSRHETAIVLPALTFVSAVKT